MAGPFLTRDYSHYAQLEAVWGTSPGALVGADAFKSRTRNPFKRNKARVDRDKDADQNQASVITTQGGRESADFSYDGDLIPSGNAATPTEPDMDVFFEAHFGVKSKATANTTTTSGSTATVINLTPGGFIAAGLADGQMFAVDVDGTFGIEVRQILSHATDAVTVDRAFSAAPASGRTVIGGTTYKLSEAQLKSLHLWNYVDGDNFRHKVGGAVPSQLSAECDFTGDTPIATVTVSGPGERIQTQTTAMPTPTTAGQPLLPDKAYAYIGTVKTCILKAGFESNNGIELRSSESCSLLPTGPKRTGNDGHYMINASLAVLLKTDGVIDGYFDNANSLTAYDVLVQLGAMAGKIVAWRVKKLIPDVPVGEQDGEVSLELAGRAYGTVGDDELVLFFG